MFLEAFSLRGQIVRHVLHLHNGITVANDNAIGDVEVDGGVAENGFDPSGNQAVGDFLGNAGGGDDDGYLDVILFNDFFQVGDVLHNETIHLFAYFCWVVVKNAGDVEATMLEATIMG